VAEVETFLQLAIRVELLKPEQAEPALLLADELGRMLNVLRQRLSESPD
jgi:hypothetical protein